MNLNLRRLWPSTQVFAVVCLTGGLVACQDSTGPVIDTTAEAAKIMELESEWSNKFGQGDIDWIVKLHASDGRQLPPGAESVVGSDALRAAWQGMYDTEGLEASWQSTAAFVSTSGDMAYDYGTASLTSPDGKTTPMKYLDVWTRVGDEWKVAADMFNANE